jgi:hypothetical protein
MATKRVRKRTRGTTETSGTKSRASAAHAKTRPKPSKVPSTVEENVAVHGLLPNVVQTRSEIDALNRVGFRKAPISASTPASVQASPSRSTPVAEHRPGANAGDWLGTTARITGCVLGLGSMSVVAPILVAAPVLAAVGIGTQALFRPLGRAARGHNRNAEPQRFTDNDLIRVTH